MIIDARFADPRLADARLVNPRIADASATRAGAENALAPECLDESGILGLLLAMQGHSRREGLARGTPDEAAPLQDLHVLLVDDYADLLELLTVVLESYGAVVTAAGSAAKALAILDREDIDVIVSDIRMPGMDGYSFLREVRRRDAQQGRAVPAIAITAHGDIEDRQRAREAGFQMHFRKPVDHVELVRAVASVAR